MKKPTRFGAMALALAVCLSIVAPVRADLFSTYVTGSASGTPVVFHVGFDPAVVGSALPTPQVTDFLRMDGIDFVPGFPGHVAVGAQIPAGTNGAITRYNVFSAAVLAPFIPSTNAVAPSPPPSGTSLPSTILASPTHMYYTENQFGFAGATHRIMRTANVGPPGMADVVFAGSPLALRNYEGLERVAGRLYFFAEDHLTPTTRALYSIGLTGGGLWDGALPTQHLGLLTEGAGGDGSDELDFNPADGRIYGTNNISGEIIFHTVGGGSGFLITAADVIANAGNSIGRLGTAGTDGIRVTPNGYLIVTGTAGAILSVDIAGVGAGLDPTDVKILYDDALTPRGFRFDDLTPVISVPEPTSLALFGLGGISAAAYAWRRRRTQALAAAEAEAQAAEAND